MDWPGLSARFRTLSPGLLLPLILIIALGLRLYGIGWDQGYGFHPDERSFYMRSDCMYRVLTEAPGYTDCTRDHPEMEPGFPSPGTFFDADKSPLNPHWFSLGSVLIYLLVAIRFLLEPFTDLNTLLSMGYLGRSIMALADVGTVFIVYLLGKRIYDRRVGLLAAALVALAVVHIQNSHFYRPEPLLVLFLTASFWAMLQVMERRRLRDSLLLGTCVGLTFATKVSVLPLVLPLLAAYGFSLFTTAGGVWAIPSWKRGSGVGGHALAAGVIAAVVFFIATPYALLDMGSFVDGVMWEATNVARTAGKVPFTVQYVGSVPFLYELQQTSIWGLGLPLGVVSWGGLLFTATLTVFKLTGNGPAPRGQLLFLAWVVPNFLMLGLFEVKFLRYIFPLIPFLILMGSGMLFWVLDWTRTTQFREFISYPSLRPLRRFRAGIHLSRYVPRVVIGVMAFVVVATAFYALAFERVYARSHPAIQASDWINENVPRNSTIVTDNHWDEGIPNIYSYQVRQIPIYEGDTYGKMDTIADHLSRGDYLIFYSNRTYGSVARLPERYPLSSRYYRLLFSENLGYRLEMAFTSYPEFLGVAFVDDTFTRAEVPEPESLNGFSPAPVSLNLGYADENVIDYDHPKVLLFKNEDGLSRSRLYTILTSGTPEEEPPPGLMLSPEQKAAQREGGTWSDIIKRDSWTNGVPVLAWLLLVELIYLAALPLATFLFRPLPDRGIILARLLGILGVSYVAWLLASLEWMSFSRTSVLVGILAMTFLSALALAARWRDFKEFIAGDWRLLAIGEGLFLAAFLSFVAIRMANPDLWHPYLGGEKPMDFAYLNAVLRSTYMPPFDPWFAGGYLNYYYWGQFIVATLIKGTGILPSVAYNLAVPLLFALTVTGAYSLVYNVTAGMRRLRPSAEETPSSSMGEGAPHPRGWDGGGVSPTSVLPHNGGGDTGHARSSGSESFIQWKRWLHGVAWGPVIAGLMAALLVAVMGNLDGIVQLVEGGWKSVVGDEAFPAFDFWRSSRMLPVLSDVTPSALTFWLPDKTFLGPELGYHITEFPFFTFLFADLHAHLVVIPFTLLALGLAVSLLVGLRSGGRWWLILTTVALAVTVGALWAINSWDYPTYVILAVLFIGAGVYLMRGDPIKRLGLFLALSAGVVVLSILAFLPFHLNYHPFPTGLDVNKWQTPLQHFLGIHGLFLFLIVTFLLFLSRARIRGMTASLVRPATAGRTVGRFTVANLWPALSAHGSARFRDSPAATLDGMRPVARTIVALVLGGVVIIYLAAAGYWTAALLCLILVLAVWVAAKEVLCNKEEAASYAIFPLILIGLALLIAIGVEFVRVKDDIGRMNTLFKYYLEVWVLFAIASAYILWYLGSRGVFRLRGMSIFRGAWLTMLALLLASGFIYPILGTRARLSNRFDTQNVTLDGADYMTRAVHRDDDQLIELRWDYDAIMWLQDNVRGSPVVLEAHNEQYHWSSRIANYTGLPTVLGWPWHQIQQRMRYDYAVRDRIPDVEEMYSTSDVGRALELLRQYEVEYVVVGQLEHGYYPERGLRKFDEMVERGLARVAYRNKGVQIYQAMW